jgi:protease IV
MSATRRVVITLVVLAGLSAIVIALPIACMHSAGPTPLPVVLHFDVPSEIVEAEAPTRSFPFGMFRPDRMSLFDVERAIRHAADDDNVRAIVLHIDSIDWGWARIAEVRQALHVFRHSGKPVYAALTGGGEREYLLASAANRICSPPTAMLALDGLSATAMFFRGTFDKIGISPNFSHVGTYKSAIESYTRADLSPPAREALDALLDDDWNLLVDTLAVARRMSPDSLRKLVDAGPFDAPDARLAGLVDSLMYEADVDSMARRRGGRRLGSVSMSRYIDNLDDGGFGPHIALVTAAGTIADGRSRESGSDGQITGSETLIDALRDARTRKAIKAIVFRIDSPGGSGQASDDIWREVQRCRRVKPVIVSMGDYAASGGYFIAMGATDILAEPGTLTGSIGVFAGKFNIVGLLHKLGVTVDTVSRGKHAQMLSPFTDFSAEESAVFQRHLQNFYNVFLERVAKGRKMTTSAVDSVGQGRVWTGRAALSRGLIDGYGGLEDAISLARRRAHIAGDENITVEVLPRPRPNFLTHMFADLWNNDDRESDVLSLLPPATRAWIASSHFPAGTILALMPFQIDVR